MYPTYVWIVAVLRSQKLAQVQCLYVSSDPTFFFWYSAMQQCLCSCYV